MTKNEKDEILSICKKLKKVGFVKDIEEHKYSIQILINCDDDFKEDSYQIRNIIQQKFENKGYRVEIMGTYWLDIIFYDAASIIDDCFNGDVE